MNINEHNMMSHFKLEVISLLNGPISYFNIAFYNVNLRLVSPRIDFLYNQFLVDVVTALLIKCFKSKLNCHWRDHPLKFKPSFMT